MNKDEVLSIPAGTSYDLIKKYQIHACPDSYTYRDSEFVTFRSYDNGIMEFISNLSTAKIFCLVSLDIENLENILKEKYNITHDEYSRLKNYIEDRKRVYTHHEEKLRFYIFDKFKLINLNHKPRLSKNIQPHIYFDLEDLISGQEIVVIKSQKPINNNNSNLHKAINNNFNKYNDLEISITNIKDEKDVDEDFLEPVKTLTEGGSKVVTIKKYERNKLLRDEALRFHGFTCVVCNFNFKDFYGDLGKDFIEVHHIVPISENQTKVSVNSQTDLTVLCANCHRMIHRKKGITLTIEELKNKIKEKSYK